MKNKSITPENMTNVTNMTNTTDLNQTAVSSSDQIIQTIQNNPLPSVGLAVAGLLGAGSLVYWYLKRKREVEKDAVQVHDALRGVRKKLRDAKEEYDSRTQWEFQEGELKDSIDNLLEKVSSIENRSDKNLSSLKGKRSEDIQEIDDITSEWSEEGPDYYNKDDFKQDVKHVLDILKRW